MTTLPAELRITTADPDLVAATVAAVAAGHPLPGDDWEDGAGMVVEQLHGYDVARRDAHRWHYASASRFGQDQQQRRGWPMLPGTESDVVLVRIFAAHQELLIRHHGGRWTGWWRHQSTPPAPAGQDVAVSPPPVRRGLRGLLGGRRTPDPETEPVPAGAAPALTPSFLRPRDVTVLTTTDTTSRQRGEGFTAVHQPNGTHAVLPIEIPDHRVGILALREHFTADPDSGVVRVSCVVWRGYDHRDPDHRDPATMTAATTAAGTMTDGTTTGDRP